MQTQKVWTIIERITFVILIIVSIYYLKCQAHALDLKIQLSDQEVQSLILILSDLENNNDEYSFLEKEPEYNKHKCVRVGSGDLERIYMMTVGPGTLVRNNNDCSDYDYHHNQYKIKIAEEKIEFWKQQYHYNQKRGIEYFKEAERHCWYMPTIEDYEMSKNCFIVGISFVGANEPRAKMIAAIISSATILGLAFIDEWNYINTQLRICQYHFEMCDFYESLLQKYEAGD